MYTSIIQVSTAQVPTSPMWVAIDHVQLAMPTGAEPVRKAHPALLIRDLARFVAERNLSAKWSDEIPGTVRCHINDPFGNRIELIEHG